MIAESSIERVREVPIVDVVSHYVDLKRSGSSYKAKSPFVDEKTASFYVVPSKNIFKDFSSGKGGDAIQFVMDISGKSFYDAIKEIAEHCNIRLEYDQLSEEDQNAALDKELLYKVNEAAAKRYHQRLQETDIDANHPAYKEVINKRTFSADTILTWQIGYAPGEVGGLFEPGKWNFMVQLVGDKSRQAAIELGLIVEKKGHTYDQFRHRVMFPIRNHLGRVVAFGGRTLVNNGKGNEFNPKYLNSPESKIFHKDKVLFGLHLAHEAIRAAKYCFLVEGYTDVISLHQKGFHNTVGTCGTALTDNQVKLLQRYCDKVVVFRDGDQAGRTAAMRDITLLTSHGFETAVVPMPFLGEDVKVDPDDLTRLFK